MTNVPIDLDMLRSNLLRMRDAIASLTAAGEDEDVLRPLRQREAHLVQQIVTGGGALTLGNVSTGGGPFIGRDQIYVTIAENVYIVGGDANGLIVANAVGERRRLPLDQAPPGKLLEFYYRWLAVECRRLPLGVIDSDWLGGEQQTVPLPDVYVDMDVIPSAPREAESEHGWALRLVRGQGEGRVPALAALAKERLAVLVGDAGSGKTTFVNYLTYLLAQPGSPSASPLPEALRGRLAVRLVLRDVAAEHIPAGARRGEAGLLWQALEADLARALGAPAAARLLPDLQQRLCQEGGLILLDGLDEVPEASRRRQTLLEAVAGLVAVLPPDTGRVLVTARPYAYADPEWRLAGFTTLALAPFDEGQQERFIQRWQQAVRPATGWSEETARKKGQDLQEALEERPYLADLATRPLLLTLMATLHSSRGQLPEDRADLYEQTVSLLLARWQRAREAAGPDGQPVVEPGILQVLATGEGPLRTALNKLAFDAHQRQRQDEEGRDAPADIPEERVLWAFKPLLGKVDPDILLAYLHQRAGLLIPRREGVYAFPHRSFQEYLAASHLFDQTEFYQRARELGDQDMAWWREVLLLAVVRGGIGSAVRSLKELLPLDPGKPPSLTAWRMVGLVGEAAAELRLAGRVHEGQDYGDLLGAIRYWLQRLVEGGRLAAAERLRAGDALGKLGDPRPGVGLVEGVTPPLPDIAWVAIPDDGPFTMGSDKSDAMAWDDEQPAHPLRLPLFYMARYPVTNAQFRPFVEGDGYNNKDYWTAAGWAWRNGAEADLSPIQDHSDEGWKRRYAEWLARRPKERRSQPWWWDDAKWSAANRPVVGVSWYEALAWCRWLDARLRVAGGVLRTRRQPGGRHPARLLRTPAQRGGVGEGRPRR
ncbi:MAG: SUMF1/EgtB/PvdO family nonheme iron enzyme [Anaerolineae bacterium]